MAEDSSRPQIDADSVPQWLHVDTETTSDGATARLTLTGELDSGTAARLSGAVEHVLHRPAPATVEVDASDLTFLDSAGIRCLLDCHHQARAAGWTFVMVGAAPAVARVLDITGLSGLFGIPQAPAPTRQLSPQPRRPKSVQQVLAESAALLQATTETRQRAEALRDDSLHWMRRPPR